MAARDGMLPKDAAHVQIIIVRIRPGRGPHPEKHHAGHEHDEQSLHAIPHPIPSFIDAIHPMRFTEGTN